MYGWSVGSILQSSNLAVRASVRAMITNSLPSRSAYNLQAINLWQCSDVETSTYYSYSWWDYFSTHVTTFFRPCSLVFNMYARSTRLNEQLNQFHSGRDATKTSISITNYWSQVVHLLMVQSLFIIHGGTFKVLLSILKSQGLEMMVSIHTLTSWSHFNGTVLYG